MAHFLLKIHNKASFQHSLRRFCPENLERKIPEEKFREVDLVSYLVHKTCRHLLIIKMQEVGMFLNR